MNAPLLALNEMQRLSSPFPESVTVKDWKAAGKKVIGWVNPYIPEEIIYAAGMLPIQVSGDNEPVQMQGAEAYILSNSCSYIRTCWQLQLDGKYSFLDGLVSSSFCDQDKRLFSVWEYYQRLPLHGHPLRTAQARRGGRSALPGRHRGLQRPALAVRLPADPAAGPLGRDPRLQPGTRADAPALRAAQARPTPR